MQRPNGTLKPRKSTYFSNIGKGMGTASTGMRLTWKHFWQSIFKKRRKPVGASDDNYYSQNSGIMTLQYPHESLPVPDTGRYRLHNEIDDCIVCDKCAKVCPVNCIDIEAVRSTEEIRKTSDGSSVRLYAAKFDIDMAKCCYCGLCTTVCPTECLTMTKTYDYSEFDITKMNYHFSEMTDSEIEEKKQILEKAQEAKKSAVAQKPESGEVKAQPKPSIKPKIKISPKGLNVKPVIKKPKKDDE